ncbi:hypothetical protein R2R35_20010 [Anaerocolumna sp. AGMB13020]|uniref:hypothetical protein n=1 Tax=Anaerocolumna sp. AGMB13020 TaxID=3081750 RepID=UPI002954F429|nr:hypothetical protein [Anaerocolumna sp. AGMB13020]WOO35985.1 hypothetical protein R2R35_19640 [Anaerocolumna sp. AGMB13020]WOO36058.1 hypothetical protein R2R35_20010 [Anaerocolumna sp. AGMB13020]
MKEKIKFVLGLSICFGIFYIWGIVGSLQWDKLTVGQTLFRGIIACTYMTGALFTYKKIDEE